MMPIYTAFSAAEDRIINEVFCDSFARMTNNAKICRERIKRELGIDRSEASINSRKLRISEHEKLRRR